MAVNGVCLTVVERTMDQSEAGADGTLAFDLSPETLSRTSLGRLSKGDAVNLERPVTLMARLGGHLVQGHVDGMGEITEMVDAGSGKEMWISLPRDMARYVVEKGSIAVDGVSLTVAGLHDGAFAVALIPHTLDVTTLGSARRGDPVNLEVDVIAKYVEGLLGIPANQKERSA
jgi:riboflavin synthase